MSDHHFYSAEWLALLLLIPILVLIDWRFIRHKHPVLMMPVIPTRQKAPWYEVFQPDTVLLVTKMLTAFFIILALADMRSATMVKKNVPVEEADIVLALDISRSMLMEDIKPNRLSALKDVLSHFVAARSTDRFGVVLYAGESLLLCPLTKNYSFMLSRINQMDYKALADGTAIGVGLASAVNTLRQSQSPHKVIILLTDGENNTGYIDPTTAAEMARRFKIKVYAIGIGSSGLAPYPITDLSGKKTYQYIRTSIDETALTNIATRTGGSYFRATDAVALQKIYAEIDKLQKIKKLRIDLVYNYEYKYFLIPAILCLLLCVMLRLTVYRSILE